MIMSSGYTASINQDLCEGCGTCAEYCQFSAIEMVDGLVMIIQEACYGCGVCVDKCGQDAVSLNLDPSKGEPLEIQKLMEEVRLAS